MGADRRRARRLPRTGNGGLGSALGYGLLFAGGLAVGLLALVAYERWMDRVTATPDATSSTAPSLDRWVAVTAVDAGAAVRGVATLVARRAGSRC